MSMKDLEKYLEDFDPSMIYTEEEQINTMDFIVKTLNDKKYPMMAIAEFAELITAVCDYEGRPDKRKSGKISMLDLIDEIADAKIALMYMQKYYDISEETIQKVMTIKLFKGKQTAYKYKEEVKKANDKLHHDLLHLADEKREKYGK